MRVAQRAVRLAVPAMLSASVVVTTPPAGAGAAASVGVAGQAAVQEPPVRPALLPSVRASAPLPTTVGLERALAAGFAQPALAGRVVAVVADAATGRVLLSRRGQAPVVPASTTKIVTAAAALAALAPEARLTTQVLAGRTPGSVVLVGAGDTTLAGPAAEPGYPAGARLADLADRVRAAFGATRVTRVLVDDRAYGGPRLGPGWRPGYVTDGDVAPVSALSVDGGRTRPGTGPRVADPPLAAGRVLARELGAPAPVARGAAAPGARVLGRVQGPPVAVLVERMLSRSDNDLAESLARQVALARGRPATFSGAATAVAEVLRELVPAAPAGSFAPVDGSGLSRDDRLRPEGLVRLLALVASGQRPRLAPVLSGLPVAAFDGTLLHRFRSGPAVRGAGVVRGKTGTLQGVSALAGLLRTREGRPLSFALFVEGVPPGANGPAEAALDGLAATLVGCGCR